MPVQGDAPVFGGNDVIGSQYLNADQLIEGGLERLHEPREIVRWIQNTYVLHRQFARVHYDQVGLLEGHGEKAVEVLGGNSIEIHVATGVEHAEETVVDGWDQFIGPGDASGTAAGLAIQQETGLLEDIAPFHFFLLIGGGEG